MNFYYYEGLNQKYFIVWHLFKKVFEGNITYLDVIFFAYETAYLFVYFSVLGVLVFICTVFLSLNVVILAVFIAGILACHETRFNPPLFLKMYCTKSEIKQLLSNSTFYAFGVINYNPGTFDNYSMFIGVCLVFLLFRCFRLVVDVSFGFGCDPDLFSLNRSMTLGQRYTTVTAFITCLDNSLYHVNTNYVLENYKD